MKNAVKFLSNFCFDDDNIIVTDAARPCISSDEVKGLIEKLGTFIAATTYLNCYETILKVEGEKVTKVIKRDGLLRQTSPEAYIFFILKSLYIDEKDEIICKYNNIGIDQLVASNKEIGLVKSNPFNFKITTPDDLLLFKGISKEYFIDNFKDTNV